MADILSKLWALFMSDPVPFITTVGTPVGGVVALIWWFIGFLATNRIEAIEERLKLASDKEKALTEQLDAAKGKIKELSTELSLVSVSLSMSTPRNDTGTIHLVQMDPRLLKLNDLANGTASAIDQALVANNELRSSLSTSTISFRPSNNMHTFDGNWLIYPSGDLLPKK
jgi:hypothetical protein